MAPVPQTGFRAWLFISSQEPSPWHRSPGTLFYLGAEEESLLCPGETAQGSRKAGVNKRICTLVSASYSALPHLPAWQSLLASSTSLGLHFLAQAGTHHQQLRWQTGGEDKQCLPVNIGKDLGLIQ